MAAKNKSFFWLANVKKIFSSETARPNGASLELNQWTKELEAQPTEPVSLTWQ
jgi:hypothetical protein